MVSHVRRGALTAHSGIRGARPRPFAMHDAQRRKTAWHDAMLSIRNRRFPRKNSRMLCFSSRQPPAFAGWREATARPTKTKLDWAIEMARLLEGRYRKCSMVTVVCDNLNTHTIGAFYEAFPASRARTLVRRLHFCQTPQHGSWLNITENELRSLARQCVSGRRSSTLPRLQSELSAWSTDVNARQRGVNWQMKAQDARGKLKALCPKIAP